MRGQHSLYRRTRRELLQPGVDGCVRAHQQRDDYARELVMVLGLRPVWKQALREREFVAVEIADADVYPWTGKSGSSRDPVADLVGVGFRVSGNGDYQRRRVRRDRQPVRTAVTAGRAGPRGPSRQSPEAGSRRGALREIVAVALGERVGVAVRAPLGEGFAPLGERFAAPRQAAALGERVGVVVSAALGESLAALGQVIAALGQVLAALGERVGVPIRKR
ncbi:MAG TPA: hypothetical protein VMA73_05655 [Streptosporangiaceae bacterium]|nr:hypothetical protein [Streptosporangiaceae bacterium]